MAPYLLATLLLAADFAHPEADAAIADAQASGLEHVAYLSLLDCPEEHRERLAATVRFLVPSLSASQHLADQLPGRVPGTQLLRLDLDGLGWQKVWPEVASRYAKDYRPDILDAAKTPPLVLSALWFCAVISDPNESGDLQYKLLYGTPPKTQKEFEAFWGVNPDPNFSIGFLEADSGVKADDADKVRVLAQYATAKRADYWITYDSKNASGEKDPLENLTARPVKYDAGEIIVRFPKYLGGEGGTAQAYFLANFAGDRQEKAPADLVEDHSRIRGVEVKNTVSCIACHTEGLKLPTRDLYREYIVTGARIYAGNKEDAREIDRFYDSPIAKELGRANEDYATFVRLCNGLTTEANAGNFTKLVKAYDAPVTLAQAAAELYTTADDFQLALGYYSRKHGLSARLAFLAQDNAIARRQWIANYALAQKVLAEWRAE